jgi:hypothetical protein
LHHVAIAWTASKTPFQRTAGLFTSPLPREGRPSIVSCTYVAGGCLPSRCLAMLWANPSQYFGSPEIRTTICVHFVTIKWCMLKRHETFVKIIWDVLRNWIVKRDYDVIYFPKIEKKFCKPNKLEPPYLHLTSCCMLPEEIMSRLYTRTIHDNENFREKEKCKYSTECLCSITIETEVRG